MNSENNQIRLVKNKQNIPAPEPDSIPDASSPDESSPEADSIADKLGKIRLRVIVNHQYIKAKIKKLLKARHLLIFRNLVVRRLFVCIDYCNIQFGKTTPP